MKKNLSKLLLLVSLVLASPICCADGNTPVLSSPELVKYQERIDTGEDGRSIEVLILETKQIILFYGGFSKEGFSPAMDLLDHLKEGLETHLYIERGFGGSVKDHKKFIKKIQRKCSVAAGQTDCQLLTFLDGQCSSMCITLFLAGDYRQASQNHFSRLGFHRTIMTIGNRTFPIQSKNSMVRYFSKFMGVNKNYLNKNKNKLFSVKNNGLSYVGGAELLEAGFAHELVEKQGGKHNYLKDFHGIITP